MKYQAKALKVAAELFFIAHHDQEFFVIVSKSFADAYAEILPSAKADSPRISPAKAFLRVSRSRWPGEAARVQNCI
jgi:hypothetical protein